MDTPRLQPGNLESLAPIACVDSSPGRQKSMQGSGMRDIDRWSDDGSGVDRRVVCIRCSSAKFRLALPAAPRPKDAHADRRTDHRPAGRKMLPTCVLGLQGRDAVWKGQRWLEHIILSTCSGSCGCWLLYDGRVDLCMEPDFQDESRSRRTLAHAAHRATAACTTCAC